jgi:hypothetical protein
MTNQTRLQTEYVELFVPQPKAAEIYYATCGMLDQHNRYHTLILERKVVTHDWAKRVNMTIFGMIVVETYLVRSRILTQAKTEGFQL